MLRAQVLSYRDLAQEAGRFLDRYHPSRTIPVPVELMIELGMGLVLVPEPDLRARTRLDAFVTRDGRELWVDAGDFRANQPFLKFTFAEEAAHFWLHGETMRAYPVTCDGDWLELRRQVKADPRFEWQAKDLAGLILVPPAVLEMQCDDTCRRAHLQARAAGIVDADALRRRIVELLVEQFEVSDRVIEIRMDRDGLWERVAKGVRSLSAEEVA